MEYLLWFGVRTEFHEKRSQHVCICNVCVLGTERQKYVDHFWVTGVWAPHLRIL